MRTRTGTTVLLAAFGVAASACASLWSFQDFQEGEVADASDDVSAPADAVVDGTLDAGHLADAGADRLDASTRDVIDATDAFDASEAGDAREVGAVCATGYHDCPVVGCSSNFSPNSCGPTSCEPCMAPDSGLTVACSGGTACVGTCASTLTLCDGGSPTGQCVDPRTDPSHCGGCDTVCPAPGLGGMATCVSSTCGVACNPGLTACPVASPTSCSDLTSDTRNCGACGNACAPRDAAQPASCVDGGCQ